MEQVRNALSGPHGAATVIIWATAGTALLIAVVHLLRPGPPYRRWSRTAATAFPAAIGVSLLVGSIAPRLSGAALQTAMLLRMTGFWATVVAAPFAVGQLVGLRPPQWLQRVHLGLAATFLLLLVASDLALTRGEVLHPPTLFGPMATVLLLPVAALAGWWLLSCLGRIPTRAGVALFALGGSVTTLALIVAALVVDPVLADHFLVVGFLPVLAAAQLLALQQAWQDRRIRDATRSARERAQ